MADIRVYDLAKELGVTSKEVLAVLKEGGMPAKSHSSTLDGEQTSLVAKELKGAAPKKPKAEPKKAAAGPRPRAAGMSRSFGPAARVAKAAEAAPAAKRLPAAKAAKKAEEAKKPKKTAVMERPAKAKAETREKVKPAAPKAVKPKKGAKAAKPAVSKAPEKQKAEGAKKAAVEVKPRAEEAPMVVKPGEEAPKTIKMKQEAPQQEPAATEELKETKEQAITKPAPPPPVEEVKEEPAAEEAAAKPAPAPPKEEAAPAATEPKPAVAEPKPAGAEPKPAAAEPKPEVEEPRGKKPRPKGPKPKRPEIEEMEGVDRLGAIPAKLKERLQPVKKGKAAPEPEQPPMRKAGGRWQGFKKPPKPKVKGRGRHKQAVVEEQAAPVERKKAIRITEGLTIKDFAERIGQKAVEIIKRLMEMGVVATINQPIDSAAAEIIAESLGLKLDVVPITDDEALLEETKDREEDLKPRPPVVTIMGHVDHGKTSLLDAVRKTDVTGGEAGGITQHIGAYKVRLKGKDIVFLDTPGHEAFTSMRARGAHVTDIVVLVVAADDGVMPQTVEAINHSKAAGVPIIVAVNKIDKPEADQERVKRELAELELLAEDWGGSTIFVPVSAKQRTGLESLLEMILLQAEIMELKANPDKPGRGVIIEAKLDKGRGPVATVLVMNGSVKQGDVFVSGQQFGRIRMLLNDKGKKEKEAGPATPVEVIGLSGVPQAGDTFVVIDDEKRARHVAQTRMQRQREAELSMGRKVTLDDLFLQIQQGEVKELNIIIKADVQGSVEAVADALVKLSTEAVKLKVLHGSVGAITESDVMLAAASNAIIIGFNVRPEPKASSLAEEEGVDVRLYNVIYNAIDEVRSAMEGLLEPTLKEKVLGRAEVRQTFSVPKVGVIAGSYVLDGQITRNCAGVRVLRDNVVIYEGRLGSLKRFKDDVKDVQAGYECGIGVENYNDIKVGDVIEAYDIEKLATKL